MYNDARKLTNDRLKQDGITVDVITGGFPCQDISVAGKQAGIEGERSGLWSEVARLIDDIQPRYAIMENVTALISGDRGRWFGRVLGDLAAIGYDAEWHCIPASELGAHHHRDRVWIIAYPNSNRHEIGLHVGQACKKAGPGEQKRNSTNRIPPSTAARDVVADTFSQRQQGQREPVEPLLAEAIENWKAIDAESGCISGIWATESSVGRVANGVPDRTHRLKCLGNAVVPQIPEMIGRAIMEAEAQI